ncbi:MAG: hypothetical protein II117_03235 [Clostridia bacterium]|nr:hypothetical protein [Clostridia bacterium]
MLSYWILKRPDGKPAGLVRVENDRVLLTLTGEIEGSFTLFSETGAIPILPESETVLPGALAVLCAQGDRVTGFAAASGAAPIAVYRRRLSQIYTKTAAESVSAPPQAEPEPVQAEPAENISQNSTMKAKLTPIIAEKSEDISQNNTIKKEEHMETVTETARDTAEFSLLLRHAESFFAAYEGERSNEDVDNMVQKEDNRGTHEEGGIDIFTQEFPGARWRYVDGTDVLPHYEGTWRQPNGQTLHILAVRGRAAPRPPRALLGFTRFLRDGDGNGYWLRLTPLP